MTYVELNPCICQLATGFLKTRMGLCQPRDRYTIVQPLATEGTRYSRHLSTPIVWWPFWYWSDRGKSYPWWGMWQAKRSSINRPTSVWSLIDSERDTTPRLPSRASQPPCLVFIIYNPKFGTWQRYIFSDVEPITAMMDSPSSLFFENFPSHMKHHLMFKTKHLVF
jgi:hypothetical protein